MIRLQGKYRLTFPVTPGEIQFKGYGNDIESTTTISLTTKNRISAYRPRSIFFEFFLPGDPTAPFVEVQGYQGPRQWLEGLERISGKEMLVTINELNLAWNVIVGPVDGTFKGMNVNYYGTIELYLYVKDEFVTWSNQKQILSPPVILSKQVKSRANTSGKTSKKTSQKKNVSFINLDIQNTQRVRIREKVQKASGNMRE